MYKISLNELQIVHQSVISCTSTLLSKLLMSRLLLHHQQTFCRHTCCICTCFCYKIWNVTKRHAYCWHRSYVTSTCCTYESTHLPLSHFSTHLQYRFINTISYYFHRTHTCNANNWHHYYCCLLLSCIMHHYHMHLAPCKYTIYQMYSLIALSPLRYPLKFDMHMYKIFCFH